ncbi:MAG: sugar phosphate isomerase/epimerase family protein [Halanaerobiales bacterium]
MKLSLLTYDMAGDLALDTLIEYANKYGYAGLEFRVEFNHNHGVELERTSEERAEIRRKLEDNYLSVASIATGSRFESPSEKERSQQIEKTKKYIELASDLDAPNLRVFGNNIPEGVKTDDCINWVGESLAELGKYAEDYDVNIGLEMHGQFNYWKYALRTVEIADHPRVGIVYNCDDRDVIAGSIRETYSYIRDHIIHIHMHNLESDYPYVELFKLLLDDDYQGFLSSEASATEDPERAIAMYASLWRAYMKIARLERK